MIHRRAIIARSKPEFFVDLHTGQLVARHTATWDDGVVDTWEERVLTEGGHQVKQERIDLNPRELMVIEG